MGISNSTKGDKKENIANFIRMHIMYRYDVTRCITTNDDKPLFNSLVTSLCEKFKLA